MPVLPRQRGRHTARPRGVRPLWQLDGPGSTEPLSRLPGRRSLCGRASRTRVHGGAGKRHPRGAHPVAGSRAHLASLPDAQLSLVMAAIRDRIEEHQSTPGLATARPSSITAGKPAPPSPTRTGSCSASPSCPRELADEQAGFARFAGGCLICAAPASEERIGYRILERPERGGHVLPLLERDAPTRFSSSPAQHGAHLHRAPTSRSDRRRQGRPHRPAGAHAPSGRHCLQHRLPLGSLPGDRHVPLARSHPADADRRGPASSSVPESSSMSSRRRGRRRTCAGHRQEDRQRRRPRRES